MTTETETVGDVVRELSQRGWTSFATRIAAAHAREVGEQCRLLDMGGERELRLMTEVALLKEANIAYSSDNANLIGRALAAEKKASELQRELDDERMDAARWRHARRILAVDEIETAQEMFTAFGLEGDETENLKADAAIDAAMGEPVKEVIR